MERLASGKISAENSKLISQYQSGEWFNKNTLTEKAMRDISEKIKRDLPQLKLTHILDREFDGECYFSVFNALGDDFVIRSKKSRNSDISNIKLINKPFENQEIFSLDTFRHRRKCYQNATLLVEWSQLNTYQVVKITISDRDGNKVFKDPMMLITNKKVTDGKSAFQIYKIYLKRSRIESVFKFLKEGMGWETVQLRDFKGIQRLLSLCFFLAAYLYEIGSQETPDELLILLAELGGGKDKISRHYIFKGMQVLLAKYRADRILDAHKATEKVRRSLKNIVEIEG